VLGLNGYDQARRTNFDPRPTGLDSDQPEALRWNVTVEWNNSLRRTDALLDLADVFRHGGTYVDVSAPFVGMAAPC
jgi:hypothetical protein